MGDHIFLSYLTRYRSGFLVFVAEINSTDTAKVTPGHLDVHFKSFDFIPFAIENSTEIFSQKGLYCGDPPDTAFRQ